MSIINHKTQLSADEIKKVINLRTKQKGVEVSNVIIEENIVFNGAIKGKLNSNFNGEIGIRGIKDNKLVIELCHLRIEKLGILKGATNIFLKGLLNKLGNDSIVMQGNKIIFNIRMLQKDIPEFEVDIDNVYIKDKLLNIEGKKLKTFNVGSVE